MKGMGKGDRPCATSVLFEGFPVWLTPPSLACLTCNPCTTSALFEYFGCKLTLTSLTPLTCKPCTTSALFKGFPVWLTPPSLTSLTCKPCTTSALFEYFGCRLTPYGCQQNRAGNASTPSPVFLPAAWLTGKQKNSAPRREVEKRCLL